MCPPSPGLTDGLLAIWKQLPNRKSHVGLPAETGLTQASRYGKSNADVGGCPRNGHSVWCIPTPPSSHVPILVEGHEWHRNTEDYTSAVRHPSCLVLSVYMCVPTTEQIKRDNASYGPLKTKTRTSASERERAGDLCVLGCSPEDPEERDEGGGSHSKTYSQIRQSNLKCHFLPSMQPTDCLRRSFMLHAA